MNSKFCGSILAALALGASADAADVQIFVFAPAQQKWARVIEGLPGAGFIVRNGELVTSRVSRGESFYVQILPQVGVETAFNGCPCLFGADANGFRTIVPSSTVFLGAPGGSGYRSAPCIMPLSVTVDSPWTRVLTLAGRFDKKIPLGSR